VNIPPSPYVPRGGGFFTPFACVQGLRGTAYALGLRGAGLSGTPRSKADSPVPPNPCGSMALDRVTLRLRDAVAHPSGEPLSTRIVEHLWQEVVEDTLSTGSRLPTVRELAVALGTSPRTIERAYEELERLGVAATRPAEGTFVSLAPPDEAVRERRRALKELAREAVARAHALGLEVDDLVEAVADWRGAPPPSLDASRTISEPSPQREVP
jgi:GntR family transcriptional regulator